MLYWCFLSHIFKLSRNYLRGLNRSLGGYQNCRESGRYIWYSATISGIVMMHSRVVTTLMALA